MIIREVTEKEKATYNKLVGHIIQSWEWGEFRRKTGVDVVRLGHYQGKKLTSAYQLTFHPIPALGTVCYFPKGPLPDKTMVDGLSSIGKKYNTAFIKLEPNALAIENLKRRIAAKVKIENLGLVPSSKSLFTKYNFLIDLTKSENQLLAAMHPKTRYNIKIAQKKGVQVYESTQDADFEIYLKLYFETTRRQKYFGHTPSYHRLLWKTLRDAKMARVLIAKYQNKPLVAWMLFNFKDTLYYPYGGSSTEHKEVMASNLVAWEAIRLGQKMKLRTFDMWGALAPNADQSDPWYGFHRFKAGYGPKHVEYVGTYDLVLKPFVYNLFNLADKLRWLFLRSTSF